MSKGQWTIVTFANLTSEKESACSHVSWAKIQLYTPLEWHAFDQRSMAEWRQAVISMCRFIDASASQGGNYKLTTSYPRKELTDVSQTLHAADVADTVLTVSRA